jgi:hypothetical protein
MISAPVTAAAVLLMFLPVFAFDVLEKRGRIATLRWLAGVGFSVALYCIAAGIALLAGRGESTIVWARAGSYWPVGLIAAGGLWAVVYAMTMARASPARDRLGPPS